MKKKYIIFLTIIFILIISIFSVATGYFKFKKNDKPISEDSIVINISSLSINYSTGNEFAFKRPKDGDVIEKKFSVTNMGETSLYYIIDIDNISYDAPDGKVLLSLEGQEKTVDEMEFLDEPFEVASLIKIAPETTQTFLLKLKYEGKDNSSNISGRINISIDEQASKSFADVIISNNQVTSPKTEPGKGAAKENEGLIKSEDDDGDTYYFRGNVNNNFVTFADMTWRIVRINGDGTVRLILDDELDSVPYNSNELEEDRSDYYTLVEYRNSSINNYLDNWYKYKLSDFGVNIVDSKFCSDTNVSDKEKNDSYYSSYSRTIDDENASFKCSGEEYTSNIGLLSIDELIFAGAYKNENNKELYLNRENIALDWWVGSPAIKNSDDLIKMFSYNANSGAINYGSDIKTSLGVRPVISIRNNLNVTGVGTEEDPYVIQ